MVCPNFVWLVISMPGICAVRRVCLVWSCLPGLPYTSTVLRMYSHVIVFHEVTPANNDVFN